MIFDCATELGTTVDVQYISTGLIIKRHTDLASVSPRRFQQTIGPGSTDGANSPEMGPIMVAIGCADQLTRTAGGTDNAVLALSKLTVSCKLPSRHSVPSHPDAGSTLKSQLQPGNHWFQKDLLHLMHDYRCGGVPAARYCPHFVLSLPSSSSSSYYAPLTQELSL